MAERCSSMGQIHWIMTQMETGCQTSMSSTGVGTRLMIIGLLLSVFLVATLATYFANYIQKHKWLGYVGIFVIIIVALQLIIGGLVNMEVLTIREQEEFLFSI